MLEGFDIFILYLSVSLSVSEQSKVAFVRFKPDAGPFEELSWSCMKLALSLHTCQSELSFRKCRSQWASLASSLAQTLPHALGGG